MTAFPLPLLNLNKTCATPVHLQFIFHNFTNTIITGLCPGIIPCHTKDRKILFPRMIQDWNDLSLYLVDSCSTWIDAAQIMLCTASSSMPSFCTCTTGDKDTGIAFPSLPKTREDVKLTIKSIHTKEKNSSPFKYLTFVGVGVCVVGGGGGGRWDCVVHYLKAKMQQEGKNCSTFKGKNINRGGHLF